MWILIIIALACGTLGAAVGVLMSPPQKWWPFAICSPPSTSSHRLRCEWRNHDFIIDLQKSRSRRTGLAKYIYISLVGNLLSTSRRLSFSWSSGSWLNDLSKFPQLVFSCCWPPTTTTAAPAAAQLRRWCRNSANPSQDMYVDVWWVRFKKLWLLGSAFNSNTVRRLD